MKTAEEKYFEIKSLGDAIPETWYEIKKPGQDPYYTYVTDTFGRYSRQRPENLPVTTVEFPAETPQDLRGLLGRLARTQNQKRQEEIISKADSRAAELNLLTTVIKEILSSRSKHDSTARKLSKKLNRAYLEFTITGLAYSRLLLLLSIISNDQRNTTAPLIFEYLIKNRGPRYDLFEAMKEKVNSTIIMKASRKLQKVGDELHLKLSYLDRDGHFYGTHFASVPYYLAANTGYEFLSKIFDEEEARRCLIESRVCEERFVTSITALHLDLSNSIDSRMLHWHREQLKSMSTEFETRMLVKTYLVLRKYYPGYYEPYLLGYVDEMITNS